MSNLLFICPIFCIQKAYLVVVAFHGHGTSLNINGKSEGFLVPSNGRADVPSELISMSDINNWSKYVKAKHLLLIFDCCFSGLSLYRGAKQKQAVHIIPQSEPVNYQKIRKLSINLNKNSRIVINAGLSEQTIMDSSQSRTSILTEHIINSPVLDDGFGSVHELFIDLLTNINNKYDQNPCMGYLPGHQGTDIFLGLT